MEIDTSELERWLEVTKEEEELEYAEIAVAPGVIVIMDWHDGGDSLPVYVSLQDALPKHLADVNKIDGDEIVAELERVFKEGGFVEQTHELVFYKSTGADYVSNVSNPVE